MIAAHAGIKNEKRAADTWLAEVVRWTWRVKLLTHLETDLLGEIKGSAEEEAIKVFADNLKDLLGIAMKLFRAALLVKRSFVRIGMTSFALSLLLNSAIRQPPNCLND